MIGKNRMLLNKATMIQALQYWLKSKMASCPLVTDVDFDTTQCVFVVDLETVERTND